MKIELSNHDFSMFQKSEAFHSAEIYSNNGEYIPPPSSLVSEWQSHGHETRMDLPESSV